MKKEKRCSTWNKYGLKKNDVPRGTSRQFIFFGCGKAKQIAAGLLIISQSLIADNPEIKIPELSAQSENQSFLRTVVYEKEIPVFVFRKQYDVFKHEPDIETARKGFSLFLSVRKDYHLFLREEMKIREELKNKEELFQKEKKRLEEIYSRKLLPLEEALEAWENQSEKNGSYKSETDSLKEKISELKTTRDKEIDSERKKKFSGIESVDFNISAEDSVKEKLIEKYRFSRYSLSGSELSLSDVFDSVLKTTVQMTEVPMKDLKFTFSETGSNKRKTILSFSADYQKSGLNALFPERKQNFRFDTVRFKETLESLLTCISKEADGDKEDIVQFYPDVQITAYQMDLVQIAVKNRKIRMKNKTEEFLDFPVGFSPIKIGMETAIVYDGEKVYCLFLPKKQKGTLAEQLCMILPLDEVKTLLSALHDRKIGFEKTASDFFSFDDEIPMQYRFADDSTVTVSAEAVTVRNGTGPD